jgi:hypothetical protein
MTVREALTQSAEDMLRNAEAHRRFLADAMSGSGGIEADECFLFDCPHRRKLRETLALVVRELDETRKSFKSKRLEALRKRLLGVLAEEA